MDKKALRKVFLTRRGELTPLQVSGFSTRIADRLVAKFQFSNIRFLHHFISLDDGVEVDTRMLAARILAENSLIRRAVPRVNNKKRELEHLELLSDTEFEKSSWGIDEPVGGRIIPENEIDFVIVPLICFDQRGHRVGYGGGYYDQFLAKCRTDCLKVGVSFFEPVDEIADIHSGDVRLDYCVTPDRIFSFEV